MASLFIYLTLFVNMHLNLRLANQRQNVTLSSFLSHVTWIPQPPSLASSDISLAQAWSSSSPVMLSSVSAHKHYCDVIMNTIACQITSLTILYLTVNSGTDQRKHQSSASLAFVRGIHRRPVNSPHKGPVTRKNVSIWWRHHEKSHQCHELHTQDKTDMETSYLFEIKWPH